MAEQLASATPACAAKALFNFGAAAADEGLVFGAARPGAPSQRCWADELRVTPAEVEAWAAFVKARGVKRVVSQLSPSELATYAAPGLDAQLAAAFAGEGRYVNVDPKGEPAAAAGGAGDKPPPPAARIMAALRAAKAAGEAVTVHCWGGGGRTGLVLAAWLAADRGLSPRAAAEAVVAHSKAHGLGRRVDVAALREFLAAAGVECAAEEDDDDAEEQKEEGGGANVTGGQKG